MAILKQLSTLKNVLKPKSIRQQQYVDVLSKNNPSIVIATGAPGSGKTLFAAHIGAHKLKTGEVNKIIITRPTISVGSDNLGFLPGTLTKKLEPWMRPVNDALLYYYKKTVIDQMIDDGTIELASLAHLRGRTFDKSWIICDEAQNTTVDQMLMMLTRIGKDSKMVITGDPMQHDRSLHTNGLSDLLYRLQNTHTNQKSFEIIEFDGSDVQRHPAIPVILELYK